MAARSHLWPDPRVKPPYGAAEIDWGHPLARELSGIFLFNEGGGKPIGIGKIPSAVSTLVGSPFYAAGLAGPGLQLNSANTQYLTLGNPPVYQLQTLTISALISAPSGATAQRTILGGNSGGPVQFRIDVGSTLSLLRQGVANIATSSTTITTDRLTTVSVTYTSAGLATFYIDGVPAGSATNLQTFVYNDTQFLGAGGGGTELFTGLLFQVALYTNPLPAGFMRWLHAEPYAMLRPIVRRRYFVVASVPSPSLTPPVGSTVFAPVGAARYQDFRLTPATA